jgi:hypothetical protein
MDRVKSIRAKFLFIPARASHLPPALWKAAAARAGNRVGSSSSGRRQPLDAACSRS